MLSLVSASRPHVPISKLLVSESYETYISRSFQVTREILAECKNQGKGSSLSTIIRTYRMDFSCSSLEWSAYSGIPSQADAECP